MTKGLPDIPQAHLRALEQLYAAAPIRHAFPGRLHLARAGESRIDMTLGTDLYHGAGAVHGCVYFKLLDDAAFFAVNSLVTDVFVLTTAFNLDLMRPLKAGSVQAHGRWISGQRRVFVAEAHLLDADGVIVARGSGTFMRSHHRLADLSGYAGS